MLIALMRVYMERWNALWTVVHRVAPELAQRRRASHSGGAMATAKVLKDRGNEAFRMGDLSAALALYTEASEHDNADAAISNNLAAVHLKLKQFIEAKDCCDEAIARDPSNAKAWVRRAQANAGLGEDGRAVRDYRSALQIQPNHATAAKELDELIYTRKRAAKQASTDPRLAHWISLFRANLSTQQSDGKLSRKQQHAEQLEAERLDSEWETRRLRKAFMRLFEREIGIVTDNDEDGGSESSGNESEDEGGETEDETADGEWETDDEDIMDQDTTVHSQMDIEPTANGVH